MHFYRELFLNIKKFPNTFWLVTIAAFVNQMGNMAFVFIVLYATQHLGYSLSQGAGGFAVISGAMLIGSVVAGNLIDRIGAVRIMIGSIFLNGFIVMFIPTVTSYYSLLGLCAIWGFCIGFYRPASQTLVSYLSPEGLQKITFSLYRLAVNLGMSIGPALGGYLAVKSFSIIFIVNGIMNILAGMILVWGLFRSKWFFYRPEGTHKNTFVLKWLLHDASLRWFLFGMILVEMIFYQHESTLAVYLQQNLHFSTSFYGLLFTVNTLMIVFLELSLNAATLNWPYRINFILGALFISLGFSGMYFASEKWHILLLTAIWTLGEMILFPSASSYIAETAPEGRRGSYMSLLNTSTNVGMLIGPWIGALAMQQSGGTALWILCGIWGFFSIVIFSFL